MRINRSVTRHLTTVARGSAQPSTMGAGLTEVSVQYTNAQPIGSQVL
jgi:hypothetical protein